MNEAQQISAARLLISSLKGGDKVRVTFDGRGHDMEVSRTARLSDGAFGDPMSLHVTVTYGPGRYAREVSIQHLVRTRCGRGFLGGDVQMERI